MDTQNPSVHPHAQSADDADGPLARANPRPRVRPPADRPSGVTHDNSRHTSRFTVIGNHLAQHAQLSLLAIGLAVHIQSLPAGARVDIRTLTGRFPEGATRIAAALRELEAHHYLRRERSRLPGGRIVTRTVSCNQPAATARPQATARQQVTVSRHHGGTTARAVRPQAAPAPAPAAAAAPVPAAAPAASVPVADEERPAHRRRPGPRRTHPLPAVPEPGFPSPALLLAATDLLTGLRRRDSRLLLSACDTAHLAPGVAAWLERDVGPDAVRHALTSGLPPEGPRRPAALLAHRLAAQLPPPPPFRAPEPPPPVHHPFQTCDACDRAFRAPEPGTCRDCRPPEPGETA
ncbi:helix-turn-helix domain-containing protein [Streptomyces sp. NBC_01497]|uniref:helix-turn-helix domain-containing protein n=1 Tax=Streptomyces sp. NBC_01497 TaxID=2903885 RepID=UPI002E33D718|nr:helix-turn-helix domain-containing protein [Streptomyces sp. NBC_01497]